MIVGQCKATGASWASSLQGLTLVAALVRVAMLVMAAAWRRRRQESGARIRPATVGAG